MYNGFGKMFFLRNCAPREKELYLKFFKNTEKFERLAQKDISDFEYQEALALLKQLEISSISTLSMFVSMMDNYALFCQKSKASKLGINSFKIISGKDIKESLIKFKTQDERIFSLEELQKFCELNLTNICDKVLIFCLFHGIYGKKGEEGEEIANITKEDVDKENHLVRLYTGKERNIPLFLCQLIEKSCDTYEYYRMSSRTTTHRLIFLPEDKSPFKKRNNSITIDNISRRIQDRLEKLRVDTGCELLYLKKIIDSGLVQNLKDIMKEKNLDSSQLLNDLAIIEKVKNDYNMLNTHVYNWRRKYKDFL